MKKQGLRGKKDDDRSVIMMGKIPPQANDIEEAVLGAVMLERTAFGVVDEILKAECFYKESHRKIWQAITELYLKGDVIDLLTVEHKLKQMNELESIGGVMQLVGLTNRISNAGNVEYHAKIVKDKFTARELIRVSSEIIKTAYEDEVDVGQLCNMAEGSIYGIANLGQTSTSAHADERMKKALKSMIHAQENEGVAGIPSGIHSLDGILGGFAPGDLIFIGARPGNGKTSLAMNIAERQNRLGFKPVVFQLEMSQVQSGIRELSMKTTIPMEDLRRGSVGHYNWEAIEQAAAQISLQDLLIDHNVPLHINSVKSRLLKHIHESKCRIAIIDYLGLMEMRGEDTKGGNDEAIISACTKKLKNIAKQLEIPIILLGQLNRDVEKRPNKRPQLSDAKGSGAIEADCDIALLLYNAWKYGIEFDDENQSTRDKILVDIAKNRMGRIGEVYLKWYASTNEFQDLPT